MRKIIGDLSDTERVLVGLDLSPPTPSIRSRLGPHESAQDQSHDEPEKALATRARVNVLRLYVAGASARSRQALMRARHLCEVDFKGQYELEVIDVYQQPILARNGQIVATPTLVKEFPKPVQRLIGDLSNISHLFVGLDLDTKGKIRP
jgi:circadian clock protein KaiB